MTGPDNGFKSLALRHASIQTGLNNTIQHILLGLALLISLKSIAQRDQFRPERNGWSIEAGMTPTLVYNNLNIGFAKLSNPKTEHLINLNIRSIFSGVGYINSYSITYSFNQTIKEKNRTRVYVPLWIRYGRANSYSSESENGGHQIFIPSLGSGIGCRLVLKNQHKIRLELGLGAGVTSSWSNEKTRLLPTLLPYKESDWATYKNSKFPFILPYPRLVFRYSIPLSKKG